MLFLKNNTGTKKKQRDRIEHGGNRNNRMTIAAKRTNQRIRYKYETNNQENLCLVASANQSLGRLIPYRSYACWNVAGVQTMPDSYKLLKCPFGKNSICTQMKATDSPRVRNLRLLFRLRVSASFLVPLLFNLCHSENARASL